jgi:arabinogalactan oligomer/maltooligosaccharide transport system substrate-binding protein
MQKLAQSKCYDSNNDIFADAAVVVTGIWNANTAAEAYGDNLGVCKLPTFTVDGTTYQLGSFSGNKLMAVKPQTSAERGAFCSALAQYLTGEECQLERYATFQWGPSNVAAQGNEEVKANVSLGALAAQGEFAIPQGNIHGDWWNTAKLLGSASITAENEEQIRTALAQYRSAIDGFFN